MAGQVGAVLLYA